MRELECVRSTLRASTLQEELHPMNTRYLGAVLDQYKRQSWKLVDAAEAFAEAPNMDRLRL